MKTMALTPKQQRFVQEYLVDLNATQAAIRAGYSAKTARSQGQRLLTNVDIEPAIAAAMKERSERTESTADEVVRELHLLAMVDMGTYLKFSEDGTSFVLDFSNLPEGATRCISEITQDVYTERTGTDDDGKPIFEAVKRTKFKLHDKRGSLDLLGRHFGLFPNRHHVSAPDGGPVNFRDLSDDQLNSRLATFLGMALAAAAVKGKR